MFSLAQKRVIDNPLSRNLLNRSDQIANFFESTRRFMIMPFKARISQRENRLTQEPYTLKPRRAAEKANGYDDRLQS